MSKAQTIRDALKANPTLSPSEIAAKLGDGITGQYVSLIRYQDKKSAGKKTAKRKARKTASTVARTVKPKPVPNMWPADLIEMTPKDTADFVRRSGGFQKARQLIDTLESLQVK